MSESAASGYGIDPRDPNHPDSSGCSCQGGDSCGGFGPCGTMETRLAAPERYHPGTSAVPEQQR